MQKQPFIGFFHDFTITDLNKPYWASGPAHGKYVLGAVLPTRDGRRTGNAKIMAIRAVDYADSTPSQTDYQVKTDAGNTTWYNAAELEQLFYPPEWVARIPPTSQPLDLAMAVMYAMGSMK
jgi:hypothetical protein